MKTNGSTREEQLAGWLTWLRVVLEPGFGQDTAAPGTRASVPSAGQCAAVAAIVQRYLGGELVSATVGTTSHWFNRIRFDGQQLDIDITGDQFERGPVQIADVSALYQQTRVRSASELNEETRHRSDVLATRTRIDDLIRAKGLPIDRPRSDT